MGERCGWCPVPAGGRCLGTEGPRPGACELAAGSAEYRDHLVARAGVYALLPAVRSCPHRGGVLPLSRQVDCGCVGQELSACGALRGPASRPDAVTLRECLECVRGS